MNNKSVECLVNQNKENIPYNKNTLSKNNITQIKSKVKEILNNYYISELHSRNKTIKFSKTEIDLVRQFPDINEIKNLTNNNDNLRKSNINNLYIYKLDSARSSKLNYTDLNKYMKQVHHINSTRNTINRTNKISLNKYFNINKINLDIKNINNNTTKTLYNNSILNGDKKNKKNKYNSCIPRNNNNTFINNHFYNETGDIINKNIKKNINKFKKEKELLKLKKVLKELKVKNNIIKNELTLIKENNSILEHNKNIKNKKVYINIKNILHKFIINDIKDYKYLLNNFNIKLYNALSFKDKINFISNIYLEEKLKNSLIDKAYLLLLTINNKNENLINGMGKDKDTAINIEKLGKWIFTLIENIDELKKKNYNIKKDIDKAIEEKDIYKNYYNNWISMLNIKNKEELMKKIDALINVKNINANEEAKMYKMLLNKKD